jgi:hypothetical protein
MLLHSQFGSPYLRSLDNRPLVVVVQVRIRYPLNSRVGVRAREINVRLSVARTLLPSRQRRLSLCISDSLHLRNVVVLVRARSSRLSFWHFRLLADSCELPVYDFAIMLSWSISTLSLVGRLLRSTRS